jgi:glycerophosphoryl diester phosphodiesterase
MKRLFFVFFLCLFLVFIATGCEETLPTLSVEDAEITLYVDDTYKLKVNVTELESFKLDYVIDNPDVIEVKDGNVKALKEGEANITISLNGYDDVPSIKVKIIVSIKPSITITGDNSVEVGEEITLTVTLVGLEGDVVWSTNDNGIATVNNGVVKGKAAGDVVITATCGEYSVNFEVKVVYIPDITAPEFVLGEDYKEMIKLNWNKPFNPLEGITAIDNKDGDLTSEIKVLKNIDNKEYGVQTVELSVTDKAGNTTTMTRTVEVVWDYAVTFIGHAGSYYGLMNSEEAILYAVQVLKYQAVEIDLKQTADGVFILCHDDTFGGYALASTNWDTLKDVTVTSGRNAGFPSQNGSVVNSPYTAKLCTLERYLEICKEYNVKAVIELKSSKGITNSDQSRMQALMDVIEAKGMRENVIFLGSQYNCLIWTRNNGYEDIPCQYLVNSFESDTVFQRCLDHNLDISINVTGSYSNNDEWLAKYKEAGIKVSTYTYTQYVDYPVVQQWIDKGVDFVTCDWHVMSKLNLPEKSKDPINMK